MYLNFLTIKSWINSKLTGIYISIKTINTTYSNFFCLLNKLILIIGLCYNLMLFDLGFPDYNCFVNLDKILTNFPFGHPAVGSVQCIHEGGKE